MIQESDKPGVVLARFDDMRLTRKGKDLGYGWHEFPAEHFCTTEATP